MVQHRSEFGGAVEANKSDLGNQIFIFNLELPSESLMGYVESLKKAVQLAFRWSPLKSLVGFFQLRNHSQGPMLQLGRTPHSKKLVDIFRWRVLLYK